MLIKKALVLENNKYTEEYIKILLENNCFRVFVCSSVINAIDVLNENEITTSIVNVRFINHFSKSINSMSFKYSYLKDMKLICTINKESELKYNKKVFKKYSNILHKPFNSFDFNLKLQSISI